MYNSYKVDQSDAVQAMESLKDDVLPKLLSGKIHTIENQDNNVLVLFDQKSGIDYVREDTQGLQGMAARVQWVADRTPYNSFTIRTERHTGAKTEYEKRQEAIHAGYFYPAFTLQAYFDYRGVNNLKSVAIMKTIDLYDFIDKNPNKVHRNRSDNKFIYILWQDITCEIKTIIHQESEVA